MEKKKLTVTKSFAELQLQSVEEAKFYLTSAIDIIDKEFGSGYAKDHPELITGMIKTMALETQGASICASILQCEEEIVAAIDSAVIDYNQK